ncbi:hypothetical protein, partial [Bacillus sp. WP8]|uniref:hypothetical protein n=1 Tax=Bacillus sp. WP8 TaxID=756828 RepID=UPI001642E516
MSFMDSFWSRFYGFIFEGKKDERVWIEIDGKGGKNGVFMDGEGLDSGEVLGDGLFMKKKSVVVR